MSSILNSHQSFHFEHLLYIDPYHHPSTFFNKFFSISNFKNIKVSLVVYGNFLKDFINWHNFLTSNQNEMSFIVASDAQKKLLEQFFLADIHVIPFPVDSSVFHQNNRGHERNGDELIFVFAGRLSHQKNIYSLIKFFAKAKEENVLGKDFKLKLIGHFDDLYLPFSDSSAPLGTYFHEIFYALKREVGADFFDNHVQFLGSLSPQELAQEFGMCDIFISLSTFSHEDFGLAAAEALESGLYAILTKWGGHSSFKKLYPESVNLIELVPSSSGFELRFDDFKKVLLETVSIYESKIYHSVLNKKHIADSYLSYFFAFKPSIPQVLTYSHDLVLKVRASENNKYSLEVFKNYAE
jgi:glycosyltransferase involved in cell wall biosynthesis